MRTPAFLGLIMAITAFPVSAEARRDSATAGQAKASNPARIIHHRWGPRVGGRWYAGGRAPGGWAGYNRPFPGYVVPAYWVVPAFYIGNFAQYGFRYPPQGLAWSRYYDDAVLIDGRGTVYDSVSDVDWNQDGGRADRDPGYAYDYDYRFADDRVTDGGVYAGSWAGVWEGGYTGPDNRRYEGTFRGTYREDGPARHDVYPASNHGVHPAYNGYYYPGPVITTITVHPSGTVTKSHSAGGPDCHGTHAH